MEMRIETRRFSLRDFSDADRQSFIDYQLDPRYRRLYDRIDADAEHPARLFDLFMAWQSQNPRQNLQIGIFERTTSRLCGCAGLRRAGKPEGTAVLGLELTPDDWGRHGAAVEVAGALLEHGFLALGLHTIVGDTASGNSRVDKLARWFGAAVVGRRDGPPWMTARGWQEVEWALSRDAWHASPARRRLLRSS
jgi:[ribosomal protein S5]-alanine N-acetyltransferase